MQNAAAEPAQIIVYCLDDGFLECTLVSAYSALKHSPKNTHVHLHHDQLSPSNKLRLLDFQKAFSERVKVFSLGLTLPDISGSHITNFALARLKVIPRYHGRILYLDGDTLIRHDLTDLLILPLVGRVFGAAICPTHLSWWHKSRNPWRIGHKRNQAVVQERLKQLKSETLEHYINSGVLLVDVSRLHSLGLADTLADVLIAAEMRWHDQDYINTKFKAHIMLIDSKYNSIWGNLTLRNSVIPRSVRQTQQPAIDDPVIVPFAGKQKPWRYDKQRLGMRLRRLTTHKKESQYIREWRSARDELDRLLGDLGVR